MDTMDIHLEAIHGWKCPDYIINWVERLLDEVTAKVFDRCLAAAATDISRDDDIDTLAVTPSEYLLADKTKLLYAHLIGQLNTDL